MQRRPSARLNRGYHLELCVTTRIGVVCFVDSCSLTLAYPGMNGDHRIPIDVRRLCE